MRTNHKVDQTSVDAPHGNHFVLGCQINSQEGLAQFVTKTNKTIAVGARKRYIFAHSGSSMVFLRLIHSVKKAQIVLKMHRMISHILKIILKIGVIINEKNRISIKHYGISNDFSKLR